MYILLIKSAVPVVACLYVGYRIYRIYQYYFGVPSTYSYLRADLSDLTGNTLSHYYVHADGKNVKALESGLYSTPPFDENGIPIVDYGREIGKQYNPVTISQFALENWELFLQTSQRKCRDTFLKQADWLVEHQEEGIWYYRFALKSRGLRDPWISAMSQGQGISVLLRAWQFTGNKEYLKTAEKAFDIFEIPIHHGGVSCKKGMGIWFEEYPNPSAPNHVMNGHIWTLFGIWDMYRVTRNPNAIRLFKEGVAALKADISEYDTGSWVLYDQGSTNLLNSIYIKFEIEQLKVIHALTKDPVFSNYVAKWEQYRRGRTSFYRILSQVVVKKLRRLLHR